MDEKMHVLSETLVRSRDGKSAEISIAFHLSELMVRMLEVMLDADRPDGRTNQEAIDQIREKVPDGEEMVAIAHQLSHVAMQYFAETVNSGLVKQGGVDIKMEQGGLQ